MGRHRYRGETPRRHSAACGARCSAPRDASSYQEGRLGPCTEIVRRVSTAPLPSQPASSPAWLWAPSAATRGRESPPVPQSLPLSYWHAYSYGADPAIIDGRGSSHPAPTDHTRAHSPGRYTTSKHKSRNAYTPTTHENRSTSVLARSILCIHTPTGAPRNQGATTITAAGIEHGNQ